MFACLSKFFAWLVGQRAIMSNPCAGMTRPKAPPARERVLNDDEVKWLWHACDEIAEPFGPVIRLMLLTGARREEVARMTWGELDAGIWMLPGSRTKNKRGHHVPLSRLAHDVIADVRVIAGKPGYVFTTNGRTPVSGFSKTKLRIDAAMLRLAQQEDAEA